MVVIRSPVWISILFTLIETNAVIWDFRVYANQASACYGKQLPCGFLNMNCPDELRIRFESLQYGLYSRSRDHCRNDRQRDCQDACCTYNSNDCFENFSQNHTEWLSSLCLDKSSCKLIQAVWTTFLGPNNCSGLTSDYVIVNYICVLGTSTTARQTGTSATTSSIILTSTASLSTNEVISSDKYSSTALTSASFNGTDVGNKSLDWEEHHKRLIISLVVVVAVLVLFAMLVIVFILHRRRCKKSSKEDAPKNQLPDVLINHSSMNFGGSNQHYKAAESSNYVEMNDEYIATYSRPVKKKENCSTIAKDEKKTGGNCATDEYDRIEFENKYAVKMTNYDCVSAKEVKKLDDTYSHVSSQSKPASAPTANEYSHGQFVRHESRSNDYTNKTAISNVPVIADNYSHIDLNAEKTKRRPSHIIEEDSYTHIELDKTTNPPRHGHALSVRTIPKSEEGSQTFKDLQSLAIESEGWPIRDMNFGVSLQDPPLQDIKAVSLPDSYIEFKVGDIYDTPRGKDQQYDVVLKRNKEQLFNRTEIGSKRKSLTEENAEDCAVRSDYELAKPIDL